MTTEIIITATALNGEKKQSTISNVNPSATNAELSELGQLINAISTNSYVSTTRVDKQDVLDPSPTVKAEGVITFDFDDEIVRYNGDGVLYMQHGNSEAVTINSGSEQDLDTGYTYFFATETANYTAAVLIKEVL